MSKTVKNKKLTESIKVEELMSDTDMGTWQADYPFTALDFEHIKNGQPITYLLSITIGLASFGFGLNLLNKYISQFGDVPQQIYKGEYITLFIGLGLALLIYLVGLALPNNKKKVMKNIQEHFENSPKKKQIIKGART